MDYKLLKIKSYKHWDLYLHENQCYLGRVFVLLKNEEGVEDFLAIEGEARDEFFQIGTDVKAALKTLFQPDKMNDEKSDFGALSEARFLYSTRTFKSLISGIPVFANA